MPRRPEGTWDSRRGCYVAALGERYTDDAGRSRRRVVTLAYEDGTPVRRGDDAGRLAAIARLIGRNREAEIAGAAPTTAELFGRWIAWHAENGTRPSTDAGRRDLSRRVCNVPFGRAGRSIGDVLASEFGPEHVFAVRAWLRKNARRGNGATSGYIRNHDKAIKACFAWAAQAIEGREPLVILKADPVRIVKSPPQYRSSRPCPTWDEMMGLLDAVDRYVERRVKGYGEAKRDDARVNALFVRVVGERGCRPTEVIELRVEDWDDDLGGFVLGRHKMDGVDGATGVGVIPLRPETAERVRALVNRPDRKGPWVFAPLREDPTTPSRVHYKQEWWEKTRKRIPGARQYPLYSFRNTASNALREAGVDDRGMRLALRQTAEVAETTYRRDRLRQAARVWERLEQAGAD